LQTYFGQSNPYLFNFTNLSIGTYKINATSNNFTLINVTDTSGFGNHIIVNRSPQVIFALNDSNGLFFDGDLQTLGVGVRSNILSSKSGVFFNVTFIRKQGGDSTRTILRFYNATSAGGTSNLAITVVSGNLTVFFRDVLGNTANICSRALVTNQKYNFVYTYNASNNLSMCFLDNVNTHNSSSELGGFTSLLNFTVGCQRGTSLIQNCLNGTIFDLVIGNTTNILGIYNFSNYTRFGGFENSSQTITVFVYNSTSGSILSPLGGYNSSTRYIDFVWTNATFNPSGVPQLIAYQNLTLLNNDLTFNRTIYNSAIINNNFSHYDLYSQNLSIGQYWVRLQQTDINGNTLTTQNRFNLTTNAIVNVTAKRINNNATINIFSTTITDQTTGLIQTNTTTDGVAIFDVVKYRNYSVVITSANYTTGNANMTINETFNTRLFYLTRFNSILINFYDEDTLNIIVNQTVYLDLISSIYSNNYSAENGTLLVELLSPTTYQARYSSVNYTERFYSFTIVNDTSQTVSLYLKKNTTSILIQVKDVALNPVEIAVVKAQKQIPSLGGIFLTVEICTTDFNGECIMSLTQNDEFYRFIVLIDGDVKLTTTANYIIDNIIPLVLPGEGTNADDSFEYLNIESDVSWTNASSTFSFDFSDPNNLQSSYCLDIYRNDVLINRTCLTSDLGSIDVALTITNGTYKANGLISINDVYLLLDQDIQYFPVAGTTVNTGKLGLLIQFLLSLVFIIAVKNNPEFIPIAFGLSLLFGKAGSLTLLDWTTVSAIAFACLVISVWLGKNKND